MRLYVIFISLLFILIQSGTTADWYTWRGPHGNGISDEKDWNPLSITNPKIVWEKNIGIGYSSVSIKDNRLYTMGNIKEGGITKDVVYCLDALSGKELWRYSYPCSRGDYPGPRATPIFEDGLLYTMSLEGHLFCFEPKTGKVVWTRNILKEYKFPQITWKLASSPVFYRDILLVNAGRAGIAFNKKDGSLVWNNGIGKAGYATPVFHVKNGITYAAIFVDEALYMVNAESGKIAWSYPWKDKYNVFAFDPLISGDKLFLCSETGEQGSVLMDISGKKPRIIWSNKEMNVIFGGNILLRGYMYGVDGTPGSRAVLKCMNYQTGEVKWRKQLGFGTMTAADNKLLFQHENGTLSIIEATPDGYKELTQSKIFQKRVCWTAPILANGKIYARNNPGQLICMDVSE